MGDTVVMPDYSVELSEIISNQQTEIELLQQQNEILLEQINGFSLICNYLNYFLAIGITVIGVMLLWNVLSKWFFRGV